MSDNTLQKVQEIFRDIFDKPNLVLTREFNSSFIEEWDSFAHINLVIAIEQEFNIAFALGELEAMKNVGDMIDVMEEKLSHAK